jgi:outer membrane protein insertion porin family
MPRLRTRRGAPARRITAVAVALWSVLFTSVALGQDIGCSNGEPEVRKLSFHGNRHFTDAELASSISTTVTGWSRRLLNLPLSTKHCLSHDDLVEDRQRIRVLYVIHGYRFATVDTVVRPVTRGVEVAFQIVEGEPTRLTKMEVVGAPKGSRVAGIPAKEGLIVGSPFDLADIREASIKIIQELRNSGYAYAKDTVLRELSSDSKSAAVTIKVDPGPLMRVGSVDIKVTPVKPGAPQQISERIVRDIIGIETGSIFNAEEVGEARVRLVRTDAYSRIDNILSPTTPPSSDSLLGVSFELTEDYMRAVKTGWGYGTLDCFRASADFTNNNFGHLAERVTVNTRLSKIGIGEPLSGARFMCPQAQEDPYSTRLNYYASVGFGPPPLAYLRALPTLSVYSAQTSEFKAYLRAVTVGGAASLELRQYSGLPVTIRYSMDFGRTEAQPAFFCAVFNRCTPDERQNLGTTQRLGVVSIGTGRQTINDAIAPSRGSTWRAELRHSSRFTLADSGLAFNRVVLEGQRFVRLWGENVLAVSLRTGAVFSSRFGTPTATSFIPPTERFIAGGPNSVRGYPQNELGSAIYIASGFDTVTVGADTLFRVGEDVQSYRRAVPVGGNSMIVGNIEVRLRPPFLSDLLELTVFTDIGDVWNRGQTDVFQNIKLKATPGIQLGVRTPVGLVRTVFGYNPYRRPAGPLYFENTATGALPCVTPGNTIPVHNVGTVSAPILVQSEGRCDAGFRPADNRTFRSRLTFSLAIGQAF